jgi:ribosomal protein L34
MVDYLAPFESPKELINGAKEQLAQLEVDCAAFGSICPYEIVTRMDNKAGEKVVALRLKNRLPPRIRRLASSILKEARLALDQAMCDAAIELGRKDAKNVYFPFGKSVADLRAARKDKCKGVDRRIVAFALRFKPYYGGNPLLWSLARLATHSHQKIIAARPHDIGPFIRDATPAGRGPLKFAIHRWNDLRNEMEIARILPGGKLGLDPNAVLALEIVFGSSGEAVAGRNVPRSLKDLIGIAEGVVLDLEAETARLKAIPAL